MLLVRICWWPVLAALLAAEVSVLEFLDFEFVRVFDIRISDFGFPDWLRPPAV